MKNKYFLLIIFLLSSSFLFAQIKVVDRSGRQPKWVNGLEKDYIITLGTGATIDDAKSKAILSVKEIIVSSIADNVKVKTESNIQEVNYNNAVNSFLEQYKSSTTSETGDVNFLQGISISKVEEFYWEKTYNKSTKVYTFNFHIKYPFSQFEINKLVSDYKRKDKKLTDELESLIAAKGKVRSIEEIQGNITALETLAESFVDKRKNQALLAITDYKNLLKSIEIIDLGSSLGSIEYGLKLDGRIITSSAKPKIISKCARITDKKTIGDNYLIAYDYSECYEDPDNHIKVSYFSKGVRIEKEFYFDITETKAKINLSNTLFFKALEKNDENVTLAECALTLNSKYDSPFVVEAVVFQWEGGVSVVVEDLSVEFKGEGNHQLKVQIPEELSIAITTSKGKTLPMMNGTVRYKSLKGGHSKNLKIFNQAYTTDW